MNEYFEKEALNNNLQAYHIYPATKSKVFKIKGHKNLSKVSIQLCLNSAILCVS